MDRILVSACLLGHKVRYDGRDKASGHALLTLWRGEGRLVPVCPEVMAGLSTPRPPAELQHTADGADVLAGRARVATDDGVDVSAAFRAGAAIALDLARHHGCRFALLTDGSPSCGSDLVYDGRFAGRRVAGRGVVSAHLQANGIEVFSEGRIEDLARRLDRA